MTIVRFLLCMLVVAFPLALLAKVQAPIEVFIKGDIAEPGTYKLGQDYPISGHEKKVLFSTKFSELLPKRESIKTGGLATDGEYLIFTASWDEHHVFRNQLERAKKFAKTVDPSGLDTSIEDPFSAALKEKEGRERQKRKQRLAKKVWKDESIAAIREQLKKHSAPALKEGRWHTAEWIIFEDGDWMAYRYADGGHPWHKDYAGFPNLFIGCDSKGNWHYSNDHFCIGMSAYKHMHGQPEDLSDFIHKGYLAPFDGKSDQMLESTWPPPKSKGRIK